MSCIAQVRVIPKRLPSSATRLKLGQQTIEFLSCLGIGYIPLIKFGDTRLKTGYTLFLTMTLKASGIGFTNQ